MQEVRRVTLSHSQCIAKTCVLADGRDEPILTTQQMRELSEDLIAYATSQGMPGVVEMVSHQWKSLQHLRWSRSPWVPNIVKKCLRYTNILIAGYGCSMCEASYKARLARQLLGVQLISSTAVALSGVACASRSFFEPSEQQCALLLTPWFTLHAIAIYQLLCAYKGARVGKETSSTAPLTCCVYAYAWRIMIQAVYGIGLVPAPAISVRVFQGPAWSWFLPHLMFALTEQVRDWAKGSESFTW